MRAANARHAEAFGALGHALKGRQAGKLGGDEPLVLAGSCVLFHREGHTSVAEVAVPGADARGQKGQRHAEH